MRLYVPTMDSTVVEVGDDGRIRLENGELAEPTLQERRAILHAAKGELEDLRELVEILEKS